MIRTDRWLSSPSSGWCLIALVAVLADSVVPEGSQPARARAVAILNVAVVPMDREAVLRNYTVIAQDGIITNVSPASAARIPADAIRVNGRNRYLMPGLADMHVHVRSLEDFASYLFHGVTTIFNLGGPSPEAPDLLRYRSEIAAGKRLGPSFYSSGPLVDGVPPIFPAVSIAVSSPAEAVRVVQRHKAEGFDLIKTYNRLSAESFRALVEAARDAGIAVGGHIPQDVSVEDALALKLTLVAHGSALIKGVRDSSGQIDPQKLAALASQVKTAGTTVIPHIVYAAAFEAALQNPSAAFDDPEARFVPTSVLESWRKTPPGELLKYNSPPSFSYPALQKIATALEAAGVPLMVGSDFPAMQGLWPGIGAVNEVIELHRAGLSRYRALVAATNAPGEFISSHVDREAKLGVVKVGYRANLLLLGANPLDNLEALRAPVGVVIGNNWLPREALERNRTARQR